MRIKGQQKGIVLLIVLGILGLMSVLAVSFVQVSRLEKAISRNYVDRTRAMMVAESGVEYAMSRLQAFPAGPLADNALNDLYFNGGVDEGDYAVDLQDASVEPSFYADNFDLPTVPVSMWSGALGSSLTKDGDRFRLKVSDESGRLNLNDTNGQWNLDTDAEDDSNDAERLNAPGRLEKIVENLCEVLFNDPGLGVLVASTLYDPMLPGSRSTHAGDRFSEFQEVYNLLVPSILNEKQWSMFRQNVTLWSWQDPNTIRPSFQLFLRSNLNLVSAWPSIGFDVQTWLEFQTKGYELEPRCPVNVNSASFELLHALIGNPTPDPTDPGELGIAGWFLREGPGERMSQGRYGNYLNAGLTYTALDQTLMGGSNLEVGYDFIKGKNTMYGMARQTPFVFDPGALAQALHDRIHVDNPATATPNDATPFQTWEEFDYFLRHEVDTAVLHPADYYASYFDDMAEGRGSLAQGGGMLQGFGTGFSITGTDDFGLDFTVRGAKEQWWIDAMYQIQVDALLANFDPNTRSQDYTSNRSIHRKVDKAHLTYYTTELCFEPTGVFGIESLGAIMDPSQNVVAQASVFSVVQLFALIRHTTQAQFMGRDALAIGELSKLDEQFEESQNGLVNGAGLIPLHDGFTLQSYPEPLRSGDPYVEDITGVPVTTDSLFSRFDGSIMLNTQQTDYSAFANFQHHFNGSLMPASGMKDYYRCNKDVPHTMYRNLPTAGRLMNSTEQQAAQVASGFDPLQPGSLYADGVFSEAGRTISTSIQNIGDSKGSIGSLAFWVKPSHEVSVTSRPHTMLRLYGGTALVPQALPYDPANPNKVLDPAMIGLSSFMNIEQFSLMYFCHDFDSTNYQPWSISAVTGKPHFLENGIIPADEASSGDSRKWGWEQENLNSFFANAQDFANPGWIPNRSFAFGWGGINHSDKPPYQDATNNEQHMENVFGRWTLTANHDYPGHDAGNHPRLHNYEGYAWNHIAMSWNVPLYRNDAPTIVGALFGSGAPSYNWFSQKRNTELEDDTVGPPHPKDKLNLAINGQAINNLDLDEGSSPIDPNDPPEFYEGNWGSHPGAAVIDLKMFSTGTINEFMRFGEFTWDNFAQDILLESYSADAVYDELIGVDSMLDAASLTTVWNEGRYVRDDPSLTTFTSPAIEVHKELNLSARDRVMVRGLAWTGYWPSFHRNGNLPEANFPGVNVNLLYPRLDALTDPMEAKWNNGTVAGLGWDPFSVDVSVNRLADPPSFWWSDGASSLKEAKLGMPATAGGADLRYFTEQAQAASNVTLDYGSVAAIEFGDVLHYKVFFNYDHQNLMSFYESPVFDDITITFALVKPRVLVWRQIK